MSNKLSRTSIVRCAAAAVLECFKILNVRWGIYGDLAKLLLCGSRTRDSVNLAFSLFVVYSDLWRTSGNSTSISWAIQRR